VVVQLARLSDGSRKCMGIHEIVGMEGEMITMQEIFAFKMMGLTEDRKVKGKFVTTGIRPKFMARLEAMGINLPGNVFKESF
jgi:pilus assembly protein CpaF